MHTRCCAHAHAMQSSFTRTREAMYKYTHGEIQYMVNYGQPYARKLQVAVNVFNYCMLFYHCRLALSDSERHRSQHQYSATQLQFMIFKINTLYCITCLTIQLFTLIEDKFRVVKVKVQSAQSSQKVKLRRYYNRDATELLAILTVLKVLSVLDINYYKLQQ